MTTNSPELLNFEDLENTKLNILGLKKLCSDVYPATTPKYASKISLHCDAKVTADAEVWKQQETFIIINNDSIFSMPGQGEITNDKCGMWVNALKCPNYPKIKTEDELLLSYLSHDQFINKHERKHDRFIVRHSCHKPTCPICSPSWAKRVATKATDRLINGIMLYNEAGHKLGRFDHVILSPPQDEAIELIRTLEGFKKLRKKATKIITETGMRGGLMIFHPFRQNDPEESNYKYDLPRYAWYPSPHFHLVGTGYLMQSDEFFKQTGWIYKKLKPRDQLAETIQYIVGYQSSHAGITKGAQIVTYFGLFSYNKLSKDHIEKIRETIKCRLCGEDLHSYQIVLDEGESMDWNNAPDLGVFIRTKRIITYKINDSISHEKSKQTKLTD